MANEEHLAKIREMGRKFIPDEEFNALLDQLKEAECRKFDGEVLPHLIVYSNQRDGKGRREVVYLAIDPSLMERRHEVMFEMGSRMRQEGVEPAVVFFVTEVWMGRNPDIQPREDPERREALAIMGCTMDMRVNFVRVPITRYGETVDLGCPETLRFEEGRSVAESELLECFFRGYLAEVAMKMGGLN